jgi:hypothetical protein
MGSTYYEVCVIARPNPVAPADSRNAKSEDLTPPPRISKRGNREVRKRLYEATLSAARYNPNIQAIYRRLKDQGKPEKVVRTAAARKLLLLAHAIYESGESFRLPAEEVT